MQDAAITARRAILHIGTEKTGTTTLQATLAEHRGLLAEQGFVFSVAAGGRSQVKLAGYASDDHVRNDIRRRLGIVSDEDLANFRQTFAAQLRAEVHSNPEATFVYSNEHCHSRLGSQDEVDRLAALLRPLFDRIDVVVYLRRQDRVATSRRSTILKSGRLGGGVLGGTRRNAIKVFYDYGRLVERWSTAFGADSLVVRRYERDRLIGGSILSDFVAATGLPPLPEPPARLNESLRPEYQVFLREMNERLPRDVEGKPNPDRGNLNRLLADLGSGRGTMPARATAREFYRRFAKSNEDVRARFFPDEATLFSEDFSDYPRVADGGDLDIAAALDITADLWRTAMREREQLLEELAKARNFVRPSPPIVAPPADMIPDDAAPAPDPAHTTRSRRANRLRTGKKEHDARST